MELLSDIPQDLGREVISSYLSQEDVRNLNLATKRVEVDVAHSARKIIQEVGPSESKKPNQGGGGKPSKEERGIR